MFRHVKLQASTLHTRNIWDLMAVVVGILWKLVVGLEKALDKPNTLPVPCDEKQETNQVFWSICN